MDAPVQPGHDGSGCGCGVLAATTPAFDHYGSASFTIAAARLTPANAPLDFPPVYSDISVMTEITKIDETARPRELPPALEHFVLQWGDLGGKWGVNRSVAQIHALLYLSEQPLTAEDIADRLGLARSNVSNSIKELQGWNLIRRVPIKCDRRDHFEAETRV